MQFSLCRFCWFFNMLVFCCLFQFKDLTVLSTLLELHTVVCAVPSSSLYSNHILQVSHSMSVFLSLSHTHMHVYKHMCLHTASVMGQYRKKLLFIYITFFSKGLPMICINWSHQYLKSIHDTCKMIKHQLELHYFEAVQVKGYYMKATLACGENVH